MIIRSIDTAVSYWQLVLGLLHCEARSDQLQNRPPRLPLTGGPLTMQAEFRRYVVSEAFNGCGDWPNFLEWFTGPKEVRGKLGWFLTFLPIVIWWWIKNDRAVYRLDHETARQCRDLGENADFETLVSHPSPSFIMSLETPISGYGHKSYSDIMVSQMRLPKLNGGDEIACEIRLFQDTGWEPDMTFLTQLDKALYARQMIRYAQLSTLLLAHLERANDMGDCFFVPAWHKYAVSATDIAGLQNCLIQELVPGGISGQINVRNRREWNEAAALAAGFCKWMQGGKPQWSATTHYPIDRQDITRGATILIPRAPRVGAPRWHSGRASLRPIF